MNNSDKRGQSTPATPAGAHAPDTEAERARRTILKSLAAGGGAAVIARTLPEQWRDPLIQSVSLPAHAQATGVRSVYGGDMDVVAVTPMPQQELEQIASTRSGPGRLIDVFVPAAAAGIFQGPDLLSDFCGGGDPTLLIEVDRTVAELHPVRICISFLTNLESDAFNLPVVLRTDTSAIGNSIANATASFDTFSLQLTNMVISANQLQVSGNFSASFGGGGGGDLPSGCEGGFTAPLTGVSWSCDPTSEQPG